MGEQIVTPEAAARLSPNGDTSIAELLHDQVIQRLFAAGVGLTALAVAPDCGQREAILMYAAQIDEALQATYRISVLSGEWQSHASWTRST